MNLLCHMKNNGNLTVIVIWKGASILHVQKTGTEDSAYLILKRSLAAIFTTLSD